MAKRKNTGIASLLPARRQARFIVRLFAEGKTESVYLQKIAEKHFVHVESECIDSSPVVLLSRAFVWVVQNAKLLRADGGRNRVWVVFDDDAKARDMSETLKLWKTCPELCQEFCKIRDRKRCEYKDVIARIQVAFMTPCVEIWGLMCLDGAKGPISNKKVYPLYRRKIQSELHRRMPTYVHEGHPYFEIEKMTGWENACKLADEWTRTFRVFPACMRATRYAGIADLVREIYAE